MTLSKDNEKFLARNERAKFKYRMHLRRLKQLDEKTVIAVLKHIRDFEKSTNFASFEVYNREVADKYVRDLFGRDLSLSYIVSNLKAIRDFFLWLERQRGYRSKINYNEIYYLNTTKNQQKAAKAAKYQKSYKYEQIIDTIRKMPDRTLRERRNKAMISLNALCSLRISELRTVALENLIQEDGVNFIYVSPINMDVKFADTRQVVFINLPIDIIQNVIGWRDYLRSIGFTDSCPLFPNIDNRFNQSNILEPSVKSECLRSNSSIRTIFEKAFREAGYEYIKPHNFRKTAARHAQAESPKFLNATRQNLGHRSIDTTLSSYGQLSEAEQRSVIADVKIKNLD